MMFQLRGEFHKSIFSLIKLYIIDHGLNWDNYSIKTLSGLVKLQFKS